MHGGVGEWFVDVTLRIDSLSALMLAFVTFVGFLIHVYSVGLHGPRGRATAGSSPT